MRTVHSGRYWDGPAGWSRTTDRCRHGADVPDSRYDEAGEGLSTPHIPRAIRIAPTGTLVYVLGLVGATGAGRLAHAWGQVPGLRFSVSTIGRRC